MVLIFNFVLKETEPETRVGEYEQRRKFRRERGSA